MRKNILTLCLVMTAFAASQSAFASRARLAVLSPNVDPVGITSSGSEHGSLLVDDAYNMFYSPARIADAKNMMIVEKGNGQGAASQGEGGFVTSMGAFNLGLFLNRTTGINGTYANIANATDAATPAATNNNNMRPVELMFGGEASNVKYGLGLMYASTRQSSGAITTMKGSEMNLRAGVDVENLEVFGNMNLNGDNKYQVADSQTTEKKMKNTAYSGGLRYKYGEWVAYGGYRATKITAPTALITGTNDKEATAENMGLGIGRNAKLTEATMMNYSLGYFRGKTTSTRVDIPKKTETTNVYVPLNVSLESEIASWFIGRAGLGYDLVAMTAKTNSGTAPASINNGTKVRLGGTLRFGKVDIDTAVGTGDVSGADNTTENVDGTAFGFSNQLFSKASLTYRW